MRHKAAERLLCGFLCLSIAANGRAVRLTSKVLFLAETFFFPAPCPLPLEIRRQLLKRVGSYSFAKLFDEADLSEVDARMLLVGRVIAHIQRLVSKRQAGIARISP